MATRTRGVVYRDARLRPNPQRTCLLRGRAKWPASKRAVLHTRSTLAIRGGPAPAASRKRSSRRRLVIPECKEVVKDDARQAYGGTNT